MREHDGDEIDTMEYMTGLTNGVASQEVDMIAGIVVRPGTPTPDVDRFKLEQVLIMVPRAGEEAPPKERIVELLVSVAPHLRALADQMEMIAASLAGATPPPSTGGEVN